jgi:8-oxo-dGTP diphosphatase
VIVVAAAILRDGELLAARRCDPPQVAGRWELPGGKVEPGESADRALVREVAEELDCQVTVEEWLDGTQPISGGHLLRAAVCRVEAGPPRLGADHDELRWLTPERLDTVDWLEPDRPFVAAVRERLLGSRS